VTRTILHWRGLFLLVPEARSQSKDNPQRTLLAVMSFFSLVVDSTTAST
jgi:hypothetical protein